MLLRSAVKRNFSVYNQKHSVSAGSLRNYLLNDSIVDVFKYSGQFDARKDRESVFNNYIKKRGQEFEKDVLRDIEKREWSCVSLPERYSKEAVDLTRKYINMGVKIIHSASLYNKENNTFGIADLLIRSDCLNKIFNRSLLDKDELRISAPMLKGFYHYVVCDIKWKNLELCVDGETMRNSGSVPGYRGQLYVYNEALGQLQGYTPKKSFIIGNGFHYVKNQITISGSSYRDSIGTVNFCGRDKVHVPKIQEAIEWVKRVKEHSWEWNVMGENPVVYPNMCIQSDGWSCLKKEIAAKNSEITSIWGCGVKEREKALKQGVVSYTDRKCTPELLGLKNEKAHVVRCILDINRPECKEIFMPKMIESDINNWSKKEKRLFVDFETFPINNELFMIGVYCPETREFTDFTLRENTLEERTRIMTEFYAYAKTKKARLYHYHHFEPTTWRKNIETLERELQIKFKYDDDYSLEWVDMLKVVRSVPLVVKGATDFSLKTLGKAMEKNGLISSKWEEASSCSDGRDASVLADLCYKGNCGRVELNKIREYNEVDVRVLCDITEFMDKLRDNHRKKQEIRVHKIYQ